MLKESPEEQLRAPHTLGRSSTGQKGLTDTSEQGRSCNPTGSPRISPHPDFSQAKWRMSSVPITAPSTSTHPHHDLHNSFMALTPLPPLPQHHKHRGEHPIPSAQPLNPHTPPPQHFHPLQKSLSARYHYIHTLNNSGTELEQGSRSSRAWLRTHNENLLGIVGTHVLKNCIPVNNESAGRER